MDDKPIAIATPAGLIPSHALNCHTHFISCRCSPGSRFSFVQTPNGHLGVRPCEQHPLLPLAAWAHTQKPLSLSVLGVKPPPDLSEALGFDPVERDPNALVSAEAQHAAAFEWLRSRFARRQERAFGVCHAASVRLRLNHDVLSAVRSATLAPLLRDAMGEGGWLHSLEVLLSAADPEIDHLSPILIGLRDPHCTLTALDVRESELHGDTLLDALKCNCSLENLEFQCSALYSSRTLALLRLITAPDASFRLRALRLRGDSIASDDDTLACLSLLSKYFLRAAPPPSLSDLTLLGPRATGTTHELAMVELTSAIGSSPHVARFRTDVISHAAVRALLGSPHLVCLELDTFDSTAMPGVPSVTARTLAEALRTACSLTSLQIGDNAKSPAGRYTLLLEAALELPTLRILHAGCSVKPDAWPALCKVVSSAECRIEQLELVEHSTKWIAALFEAVASNQSLRWLRCPVGDDDGKIWPAVVKCIRSNTTLRSLHLDGVSMWREAVRELPAALTANRSLTELHCNMWPNGDGSSQLLPAVRAALLANRSLTALDLGWVVHLTEECKESLRRNRVSFVCIVLLLDGA
jgi:hypothetical protein